MAFMTVGADQISQYEGKTSLLESAKIIEPVVKIVIKKVKNVTSSLVSTIPADIGHGLFQYVLVIF